MLGLKQLQDPKMKEEDKSKLVKKKDLKKRGNFSNRKIIREKLISKITIYNRNKSVKCKRILVHTNTKCKFYLKTQDKH